MATGRDQRVHASAGNLRRCHRIARQLVSRVGKARSKRRAFRVPEELDEPPLLTTLLKQCEAALLGEMAG